MTESGDPHRAAARVLAVALLAACAALLTGCTADARSAGTTASPFAGCAALTEPLPSASTPSESSASASASAPSASTPSGSAFAAAADNSLPEIELPCFTGGGAVRLSGVRGPAVINLWASWCEPCRTELPAIQQLADRAAGKLTVLGVNTGDDRDAAASFGADNRIAMPTLYDRDKTLIGRLGRSTLPVTIFLSADGSRHVEPLPLDDTKLDELVRTWTGVTVTS